MKGICAICGAGFITVPTAWNRRRCDDCREKNISASKPQIQCAGCGQLFAPRNRSNRDANLYCSKQCPGRNSRVPDNKWTHWWFKTCICGNAFRVRSLKSTKACCSSACSHAHTYTPTVVQEQLLTCPECGVAFVVPARSGKGSASAVLYCSSRCARRVGKRQRKACIRSSRKVGEVIRFAEVYDRDNGRCHVCGLPCIRNASAAHPLKATLDHVVPLSQYGEHTADNVKLAHFLCNVVKSDRLIVSDDLRLVARAAVLEAMKDAPAAWRLAASSQLCIPGVGFRG